MTTGIIEKPAIPGVPKPGGERSRFDSALKEAVEIILGRRSGRVDEITDTDERWEDLLGEINPGRLIGVNAPSWKTWLGGIRQAAFDPGTMNEIEFSAHIPHKWKFGTPIYWHVHWSIINNAVGTARFGLEYTMAAGHSRGAFPVTQTAYIEQAYPGDIGGRPTHVITECSDAQAFNSSELEPDALVVCRIFRDATSPNDTLNASDVYIHYVDCHFQVDGNFTTTRYPVFGRWIKNTNEHAKGTLDKINEIIRRIQG